MILDIVDPIKLANDHQTAALIGISSLLLTILFTSLYIMYRELPKYILIEDTLTNTWSVEVKTLFGYVTEDSFFSKKEAEELCTKLNDKVK